MTAYEKALKQLIKTARPIAAQAEAAREAAAQGHPEALEDMDRRARAIHREYKKALRECTATVQRVVLAYDPPPKFERKIMRKIEGMRKRHVQYMRIKSWWGKRMEKGAELVKGMLDAIWQRIALLRRERFQVITGGLAGEDIDRDDE